MAARAADKIAFLLFDFKTYVSFLNAHRTALYYGRQKMWRKTGIASGKTSAQACPGGSSPHAACGEPQDNICEDIIHILRFMTKKFCFSNPIAFII